MRIGLCGYNTASGLGLLNRELVSRLPITDWLITAHKKLNSLSVPSGVRAYSDAEADYFFSQIDTLLFCEAPRPTPLAKRAKVDHGLTVVCVPDQEWFPLGQKGTWTDFVDLFICPTQDCYNQLRNDYPTCLMPWPIDTDRFSFRARHTCKRFVFVNGWGGWKGRKGLSVVLEAKRKYWPGLPLILYTQKELAKNCPGIDLRGPVIYQEDLYREGDVLLLPHSIDGIGLEHLEALSCGLPVIATDGKPWTERPHLRKIAAKVTKKKMPQRWVQWYHPSPASLAQLCREVYNKDIYRSSLEARAYAEHFSWRNLGPIFLSLIGRASQC